MATELYEIGSETSEEPTESGFEALIRYSQMPNIAEELDERRLSEIAQRVLTEYDVDKESRAEWEKMMEQATKLTLQKREIKSYPWPNASNVKWPLLTTAATEFAARAYPAIVGSSEICRSKIYGSDPQGQKAARSYRVAEYMNYQMLEEMDDWECDMDKLLHIIPIMGCCFKKTYFSPAEQTNVSELVHPDNMVVNYYAKDMRLRATELVHLYPFEIIERIRSGLYLDFEFGQSTGSEEDEPDGGVDLDRHHLFLEQHRLLDLDDDGYPEPYIVTVHKQSGQVVRIVARYDEDTVIVNGKDEVVKIKPIEYYTKYVFMESPDCGFYGMGFGLILTPINEAVNATVNQMIDAGHLANTGGGFIGSGLQVQGGSHKFQPGEFKKVNSSGVDLRTQIVNFPFPGPNQVLFSLMGSLIQAGQEIANTKDILDAAQNANVPATTTLALIEQGMVQYTAIFKRIFKSLTNEIKKLHDLNSKFLNDQVYFIFHDEEKAVARQDFAQGDMDICLTADPNMVSNTQKLGRAQFLMQFMGDPMFNPQEIRMRILEAAGIGDTNELLVPPPQPQPDPQLIIEQGRLMNETREVEAKILEITSKTLLNIAKAESEEAGQQLDQYRAQLETLRQQTEAINATIGANAGGASGMGGQPIN